MFLRSDLDELLACEQSPAISIYLPTHKAGREVRQDAIRLRNLLAAAAKRLGEQRRPPEIEALIEPARKLIDDEEFWRYQDRGLAIFLAPGFRRIHKLAIEMPEELTIGKHFRIRPLLPILDQTGWYWVLTISAGRTRLCQVSRWAIAEVGGLDLPQGIEEIFDETVYEGQHYASPTGRPSRGPAGLAKAQIFGEAPEELRKTQLIELLRRIAAAVEPVVKRRPAPVVLAAQPEIQGNFRELAAWKELLPGGIQENPDAMADDELRAKSWELFEPSGEQSRTEALGRLHSLIGNGNGKTTTKPEEIVKAARYGRVERLFLTPGTPLWGRFVEAEDRIVAHGTPGEGDEDLLDYAALMTLRQGGEVTLVEPAEMPPGRPAAAILRY